MLFRSAFLDDGRICLTNNAAERALRAIALGRKAWLTDVLSRVADISQSQLHELLRWHWKQIRELPPIGMAA